MFKCVLTSPIEFISIELSASKGEDEPGIIKGTADVSHPIATGHLPAAAAVCGTATALDTAMDMVDPQPTLVELLVRHVLLPRELLPQIEINSNEPLSELAIVALRRRIGAKLLLLA
jgi:hypothetical protein